MSTVKTKAEHVDMEAEEYHTHPAIGASMLETFRESRREFYGRYVAKTLPPKEPSDAMKFGTLVHLAVLEPERFAETVVTMPNLYQGEEWNWRKPAHREARDAMQAKFAAEGKTCIELGDWEAVEAIAKSIRENKYAHRLVNGQGQPEFSIFWTDHETGLELKCRVDWFASIPVDIKTTNDPSPEEYARTCLKFGYHRKASHYLAGIEAFNDLPTPMVHLAVGTKPPYVVAAYEINDRDSDNKSLGYQQWRATLASLARCYETGDWREPWEKQITSLRLPGWAFTEDLYQVGD